MNIAPDTLTIRQSQAKFALRAKTQLLKRGLSIKDLAVILGLARNTVSMAINHPTVLPTVKERIRTELKMK